MAVKIMEENDIQVTNILSQTCCGALQHHAGESDQTLELAMKNIQEYEKYDFDFILNTIDGCGPLSQSMTNCLCGEQIGMREQKHLLKSERYFPNHDNGRYELYQRST